jgi:hypothetical protein
MAERSVELAARKCAARGGQLDRECFLQRRFHLTCTRVPSHAALMV